VVVLSDWKYGCDFGESIVNAGCDAASYRRGSVWVDFGFVWKNQGLWNEGVGRDRPEFFLVMPD
jgi:hypothetical protein